MKKIIYILGSIVMVIGMISCEKQEIDPGMAPNHELAGTWSVIEYTLDMDPVYGPSHVYTYNTSFDADSIWVDNIYDSGIKVKAFAASESSFSVDNAIDVKSVGKYQNTNSLYARTSETLNISMDAANSIKAKYNKTITDHTPH